MLDTTTVSVKSALQRARARLQELGLVEVQISEPTAPAARALLDQYMAAFENADTVALERLLVADAVLEATPLQTWFSGRTTCVSFLRILMGAAGTWRMLASSPHLPLMILEHAPLHLASPEGLGVGLLAVVYLAALANLTRWPRTTWLLPLAWLVLALSSVRHSSVPW